MIGIYKITNKINNKVYIGQSVNIKRRWKDHIRGNKKCSSLIHSAINKYGVDSFDFEVLFEFNRVNYDLMNILEIAYIKYFNSLSPNGYNLDSGGKNKIPSDDTRKKISENTRISMIDVDYTNIINANRNNINIERRKESLKEYYNNMTSDEKEELSNRLRLINNRDDVIEKKREKMIGRFMGEDNPFYGRHHSEETKDKIRNTKIKNNSTGKGIEKSDEWRKKNIGKYMRPDGVIVEMWKSAATRFHKDWKFVE